MSRNVFAIAPVDYAEASVNGEGNILFNWTNNAGDGTAKKDDRAILVAWFPESSTLSFHSVMQKEKMKWLYWKQVTLKALQKHGLDF